MNEFNDPENIFDWEFDFDEILDTSDDNWACGTLNDIFTDLW